MFSTINPFRRVVLIIYALGLINVTLIWLKNKLTINNLNVLNGWKAGNLKIW